MLEDLWSWRKHEMIRLGRNDETISAIQARQTVAFGNSKIKTMHDVGEEKEKWGSS